MIKYRTRFDEIEALEVERETAHQVFLPANNGIRAGRENKVSDWRNWHDSWEVAHAFLVANAERDVESLRMRLEQAKGKLGQIRGMKPSNALGKRRAATGLKGIDEDGTTASV